MAEKHLRGLTSGLATYFLQNADRRVSIDELADRFPQWTRARILGAISGTQTRAAQGRVVNPIIASLEKIHTGLWIYRSGTKPPTPVKKENVMLVEVLKEREQYLIVEDTEDGKLYKMTLIG